MALSFFLEEVLEAQWKILQNNQNQFFSNEIQTIQYENMLSENRKLASLRIFKYDDGLLKILGRTYQPKLNDNVKYPILRERPALNQASDQIPSSSFIGFWSSGNFV